MYDSILGFYQDLLKNYDIVSAEHKEDKFNAVDTDLYTKCLNKALADNSNGSPLNTSLEQGSSGISEADFDTMYVTFAGYETLIHINGRTAYSVTSIKYAIASQILANATKFPDITAQYPVAIGLEEANVFCSNKQDISHKFPEEIPYLFVVGKNEYGASYCQMFKNLKCLVSSYKMSVNDIYAHYEHLYMGQPDASGSIVMIDFPPNCKNRSDKPESMMQLEKFKNDVLSRKIGDETLYNVVLEISNHLSRLSASIPIMLLRVLKRDYDLTQAK